jgi:hypothetical protein
MRRVATLLFASCLAMAPGIAGAQNQAAPHAWLFGAWTGGLFPAPSSLTAQECLAQPTVIFTRDIVMRATLTEATYVQRLIETVRRTTTGAEFRFAGSVVPQSGTDLMGLAAAGAETGFGCDSPDVLNVQRRGENEIAFPGCADYPYPLVRCPGR